MTLDHEAHSMRATLTRFSMWGCTPQGQVLFYALLLTLLVLSAWTKY